MNAKLSAREQNITPGVRTGGKKDQKMPLLLESKLSYFCLVGTNIVRTKRSGRFPK